MIEVRNNIIEVIGNTPIVQLRRVSAGVPSKILVKCEFMNPGGSVKDRIGHWIIEDAEKRGLLKPGGTIVEATSGNTGMGLAVAAAVKGYKTIFVLPDKMSLEKIKTLRAFGAKVVVTPTAVEPDDPRSHYSVSKRLADETPNAFLANQYHNLANREAHYNTTGPEIWRQTGGKVDMVFGGMGTGGTISGIAKFLKEKNPAVKIVGVDPVGSILFDYFKTGKIVPTKPYKVEGIGEDMLPANLDFKLLDDIVQVSDQESFPMTRKLLLQEGLFVGVSAGAAVAGAIKYAKTLTEPKNIVVILPDSGNRYLSKVFDDDWCRENGFLSNDELGSIDDLLSSMPEQKPVIANPQDKVSRVIELMESRGISQLPVVQNKTVIGLIEESDVLKALLEGRIKSDSTVSQAMQQGFALFSPEDSVSKLSHAMSEGKTTIVVRGGEVAAIVAKIDLISYLGRKAR